MLSNVLNYRKYSERLFIKEWDALLFRSYCSIESSFGRKGAIKTDRNSRISIALLSIILLS